MSKFINSNCYVSINGTNLSYWAFNVDLHLERDQVDVSGFNSAGAKEWIPGTKDEELVVSFRQDFGSSAVDQTLWPLYNNSTVFAVTVIPDGSSPSSTNPAYSGTAQLFEYHPLDGAFGSASETQVTFKFSGGVSRATA